MEIFENNIYLGMFWLVLFEYYQESIYHKNDDRF